MLRLCGYSVFFGGGRSASPGSFVSRASGLSQDDWAGGWRRKNISYIFLILTEKRLTYGLHSDILQNS